MKGSERAKFVTSVKDTTFYPEKTDAETVEISQKVRTKVQLLIAQQSDQSHLAKQCLPPVPKVYAGPHIQNRVQNERNNAFVVTNDAHVRNANPGYKRNELGGFFCH